MLKLQIQKAQNCVLESKVQELKTYLKFKAQVLCLDSWFVSALEEQDGESMKSVQSEMTVEMIDTSTVHAQATTMAVCLPQIGSHTLLTAVSSLYNMKDICTFFSVEWSLKAQSNLDSEMT